MLLPKAHRVKTTTYNPESGILKDRAIHLLLRVLDVASREGGILGVNSQLDSAPFGIGALTGK